MSNMICPECGHEINEKMDFCEYCGYPIEKHKRSGNDEKNRVKKIKSSNNSIRIFITIIMLVSFALGTLFLMEGFNVKNNYYSSSDYPNLNVNAYVGGDAYNYIINGTYFSGYMSISGAFYVVAAILFLSIIILSKYKEKK